LYIEKSVNTGVSCVFSGSSPVQFAPHPQKQKKPSLAGWLFASWYVWWWSVAMEVWHLGSQHILVQNVHIC